MPDTQRERQLACVDASAGVRIGRFDLGEQVEQVESFARRLQVPLTMAVGGRPAPFAAVCHKGPK